MLYYYFEDFRNLTLFEKNLTFSFRNFSKIRYFKHLHHDLLKFSHVTEILNFHVFNAATNSFSVITYSAHFAEIDSNNIMKRRVIMQVKIILFCRGKIKYKTDVILYQMAKTAKQKTVVNP